jgi:hypothetical protein
VLLGWCRAGALGDRALDDRAGAGVGLELTQDVH